MSPPESRCLRRVGGRLTVRLLNALVDQAAELLGDGAVLSPGDLLQPLQVPRGKADRGHRRIARVTCASHLLRVGYSVVMAKSSLASSKYVPGSSRMPRSGATFLQPVEHIAQGERIRALREGRHLSQPQVLRGLEEQEGAQVISLRGYQLWEGSKPKKPKGIKWENAVALAKFFEVDPEVLVTREVGSVTTPDLMQRMDGNRSQLDRIEALLVEIRDALLERREGLPALPPSLEALEPSTPVDRPGSATGRTGSTRAARGPRRPPGS